MTAAVSCLTWVEIKAVRFGLMMSALQQQMEPSLSLMVDFQAGITGWSSGAAVAANITSYFAVVETTSAQVYEVNLSQIMTIVPDTAYTITFKAKSSIERTIIAGIGLNSGDYANSAESVSLTTEWQTFTLSQTSTGFGDDNSRVLFDMGGDQGGQVWIDDVSVK